MNSRERVLRALEHKDVDIIPYWVDFTSIEAQIMFMGEKFFQADPFTQALSQARFLNSDIITLPIVGFPGCYDIFCEKLYEGPDYILSKTPFGGIHYWRKKPYFAKILHNPIRTEDDLKSVPSIELDKYDSQIRALAELARKLSERGYFILAEIKGPFESPWMFLRGLTPYMMDLVRRPDFVTRMIEVSFNPILDLAERVAAEAPIDGIWVTDDLGESKGPFLSVEKYRAIYQPWHKQLVDRLHKKDSRVFLHSHGNIMPLVGQLVNCGFDSLDPFDPTDNMNLPELKSLYGEKVTLTGGITKHIGTLSPEEIDLHIKQVVETAGPYGFILNCGGGIPPEMSLEAITHYSDALERRRRIHAKNVSS